MSKILYSIVALVIAFASSQVFGQLLCPSVQCPDDNGSGDVIFLPDPTNCSRYYICANNFAICQECPYPTVWDPTLDSCNQPGAYHCEPTTTSTIQPPSTTRPSSTTGSTVSPSVAPSTAAPSTTVAPTTVAPTTVAPSSAAPTTIAPTTTTKA